MSHILLYNFFFSSEIMDVTTLQPLKAISTPRFDLREKMGKLFLQVIFEFPSGFVLGVVTPLNFAELDHLPAGDSGLLIKNLDRVLFIGQIILNADVFERGFLSFIFRSFETLLELRHVEHTVHIAQLFWQS